jgi:hypothetical protein
MKLLSSSSVTGEMFHSQKKIGKFWTPYSHFGMLSRGLTLLCLLFVGALFLFLFFCSCHLGTCVESLKEAEEKRSSSEESDLSESE